MADQTTSGPLDRLAIQKALQANWEEAVKLNLQILENDPENATALNRLGIAYLKNHQPTKARKTFEKVLNLDPFNAIAKTNIKKTSPKFSQSSDTTSLLSNHSFSFIEEPGKSKVIPLTNIGEPEILAGLFTGKEIFLKIAARKVKIVTEKNKYIGSLPDDISSHLIRLIKAGYKYKSLIKSADTNQVQVFIQEIKASKRLRGIHSFSPNHSLDDLDISSGPTNQPPLEIYDQPEDGT